MNSLAEIWNSVLEVLRQNMTTTAMNTWFNDCEPIDISDNCIVLKTSTDFKRSIIENRFGEEIRRTLSDLFSCPFEIKLLVGEEVEEYKDEIKNKSSMPEMDGYNFDNFIVGNSNRFAHAAAMAVAKDPGRNYNPLMIYGNSGLGKTHLLLAIGQYIEQHATKKIDIKYVKGDDFTVQLVESIRSGKAEEFRQRYRNVDLLLVDDIQFIAGKEATQEEFFHTFNNIYEAGHQIVITSDRPPVEMTTLDDRLRTRFEGGLIADVQPPDLETRAAIIRKKAASLGMVLKDEYVDYIAKNLHSNIRQIEGVVKRLTAYYNIMGDITKEIIDKAIEDVTNMGVYIPTADIILEETARYYNLKPDDIKSQRRNKNIALARQVSMYLIRELIIMPFKDIGNIFGRDHSTVISSVEKINSLLDKDDKVKSAVRDITSNVNAKSGNVKI